MKKEEKVQEEKITENTKEENVNKNMTLRVFEFLENIGIWILEKIHLTALANWYKEHIEGMRYLICGGLSTVVNILGYALGSYVLFAAIADETLRVNISDNFAFILALVFAYWVNKTIVFNSKCENFKALMKEIISFTGCRIFTQIISLAMMNFAVVISMNDMIMKVLANIVVIIVNFILSKLIIFKKKD